MPDVIASRFQWGHKFVSALVRRRWTSAGLTVALAFAGAVVSAGLPVLTAAPAQAAPSSFPSARLAEVGLRYVGRWGGDACNAARNFGNGQCKQFVNCLIALAGGHDASDGSNDYAGSYLRAGGKEVTEATAEKGDIIQWGSGWTASKHTAIVLARKGGHEFEVVDSNWVGFETVGRHTFDNIDIPGFPKPRFIRVGKGQTPVTAPPAPVTPPPAPVTPPPPRVQPVVDRRGSRRRGDLCIAGARRAPFLGCLDKALQPALAIFHTSSPAAAETEYCRVSTVPA